MIIIRLLEDLDKKLGLDEAVSAFRANSASARIFSAAPQEFQLIPGSPFAYWASSRIRKTFERMQSFETDERTARVGLQTGDDFRFMRLAWEVDSESDASWRPLAKGGPYSPMYADIYLTTRWARDGIEVKDFPGSVLRNPAFYSRRGLTWSLRTKSRLSMRAMPKGCIFTNKGPAIFVSGDDSEVLLALLALSNSSAFYEFIKLQLAAGDVRAGGAAHSFEVGVIQKVPIPEIDSARMRRLADCARRAWTLQRTLDSVVETSHAFALSSALRERTGYYDPPAIETELARIQSEVETIAADLYGVGEDHRTAAQPGHNAAGNNGDSGTGADDEADDEDNTAPVAQTDGLLSWAVGVAFGRFDWRLATGERTAPPDPEPFDPLSAKSPGMLPDGAAPFHAHAGILVDDPGHPHDLLRVVEEVLTHVDALVSEDLRRWLQKDFFSLHLQRYSKSRRKAPIYWPMSTVSGGYTLWVYYPSLSRQTLYTAINDFVEPKLKQAGDDVAALQSKGTARTRDDEKRLEALQTLALELSDLRDTLQDLADTYQPNHDDGVQINAAPLWPLFRHKPWQKLLKDTWAKLEKGDYDWAHLAMTYWPERVRGKCKADKSLAIAHGLEDLYIEPEAAPKKTRGRKKAV